MENFQGKECVDSTLVKICSPLVGVSFKGKYWRKADCKLQSVIRKNISV